MYTQCAWAARTDQTVDLSVFIEKMRECPAYLKHIGYPGGLKEFRFSPGVRTLPATYDDEVSFPSREGMEKRYTECVESCHCPRKPKAPRHS